MSEKLKSVASLNSPGSAGAHLPELLDSEILYSDSTETFISNIEQRTLPQRPGSVLVYPYVELKMESLDRQGLIGATLRPLASWVASAANNIDASTANNASVTAVVHNVWPDAKSEDEYYAIMRRLATSLIVADESFIHKRDQLLADRILKSELPGSVLGLMAAEDNRNTKANIAMAGGLVLSAGALATGVPVYQVNLATIASLDKISNAFEVAISDVRNHQLDISIDLLGEYTKLRASSLEELHEKTYGLARSKLDNLVGGARLEAASSVEETTPSPQ